MIRGRKVKENDICLILTTAHSWLGLFISSQNLHCKDRKLSSGFKRKLNNKSKMPTLTLMLFVPIKMFNRLINRFLNWNLLLFANLLNKFLAKTNQ